MSEAAAISQPLHLLEDHLIALMDTAELCEQVAPDKMAELQAEIAKYIDLGMVKRDRIASFLGHCEAQAAAAMMEINRLKARKDMFTKTAERLEGYVVRVMEERGVTKLEGNTSTLALRKCPDAVEITDQEKIPEVFVVTKVERTPDKAAIKTAIKAGQTVPGADLRIGKNSLQVR